MEMERENLRLAQVSKGLFGAAIKAISIKAYCKSALDPAWLLVLHDVFPNVVRDFQVLAMLAQRDNMDPGLLTCSYWLP